MIISFWGGRGQRKGYWGHILLKTPKVALISEYLAADALCIINIGFFLAKNLSFLILGRCQKHPEAWVWGIFFWGVGPFSEI